MQGSYHVFLECRRIPVTHPSTNTTRYANYSTIFQYCGWVAGLSKLITNSAQAEARARAELGNTILEINLKWYACTHYPATEPI